MLHCDILIHVCHCTFFFLPLADCLPHKAVHSSVCRSLISYYSLLPPCSPPRSSYLPLSPFMFTFRSHALYEYIHILTTVCKHAYICVYSNTNLNLGSMSGRTSSMKLSSGLPMQGVVCTLKQQ